MHMASTVLLVFCGFGLNRLLGWSLFVFALFIAAGSVHLGWHYAVDSYAGAALAVAAWKLSATFSQGVAGWHRIRRGAWAVGASPQPT
jgi:hypothetical protein